MPQEKPKLSDFLHHETKKHSLLRFLGVLGVVIVYCVFMSFKFGAKEGIYVTALTWSFFTFCTPISDAGLLLAFPIRLLIGMKMLYTQIASFFLALGLSAYAFFQTPHIYDSTIMLKLYHKILAQPWPFWCIIIISIIGTIFSIYFADELVNISSYKERKKYSKHINKYQTIVFIFVIGTTIILYDFLLKQLGVSIPL